jgi:hypothetical protein
MGTRFVPEVLTGKRNEAGIARGESRWRAVGSRYGKGQTGREASGRAFLIVNVSETVTNFVELVVDLIGERGHCADRGQSYQRRY